MNAAGKPPRTCLPGELASAFTDRRFGQRAEREPHFPPQDRVFSDCNSHLLIPTQRLNHDKSAEPFGAAFRQTTASLEQVPA
jgi:hypothetical protein